MQVCDVRCDFDLTFDLDIVTLIFETLFRLCVGNCILLLVYIRQGHWWEGVGVQYFNATLILPYPRDHDLKIFSRLYLKSHQNYEVVTCVYIGWSM